MAVGCCPRGGLGLVRAPLYPAPLEVVEAMRPPMRILVTGGCGFQGSHLALYWARQGHDITVLNTFSSQSREIARALSMHNYPYRVVWGSVTDPEIVNKAVQGQDVVVHLAAWTNPDISIKYPTGAFQVNAEGTMRVLEAVRQYGCQVIVASSCEVYGTTQELVHHVLLQAENTPLAPHSPYAAGKTAGDRLAHAYFTTYNTPVVILRPCNIFGPRQRKGEYGAVIPNFVEASLKQSTLVVRGSGDQFREYLYITDLVVAYNTVLQRFDDVVGMTLNIGSGQCLSVLEIAQFLVREVGGYIEHSKERPGEVRGFCLDSSHAREVLGWRAETDFWEGLKQYIWAVKNGQG